MHEAETEERVVVAIFELYLGPNSWCVLSPVPTLSHQAPSCALSIPYSGSSWRALLCGRSDGSSTIVGSMFGERGGEH